VPDVQPERAQLEKASATYKIPVLRHDFPLPNTPGRCRPPSSRAFFDQTSKETGNQFRDLHVLEPDANQSGQPATLCWTHSPRPARCALPFVVDPQGKLAAQVSGKTRACQRIGLDHTPTIYIVSAKPESSRLKCSRT